MVKQAGGRGARSTRTDTPTNGRSAPSGSLSESAEVEGLGARGRRLWASLADSVDGTKGLVLLEEACRTADRLDKLAALLLGDADVWCSLVADVMGDGSTYELRITGALVEARQQANVLRQLVAALPLKESGDDDDGEGWVDDAGEVPT